MSVAIIQGASGSLGQALTRHILRNTNLSVYALTHRPSVSQKDLKQKILDGSDKRANDRLSVIGEVDVRDERGLERAAKVVREREGKKVRLVACMAGILQAEKSLSSIDPATALAQFQVNSLGHLLTYKHFVPLIPTKKAFQNLSSGWSSEQQQPGAQERQRQARTDGGDDVGRGEGEDPANGLIGLGGSLCFSMSARVGSIADNERGGWYSYRASKAALNQIVRCLDHELINKSSSALAIGYHPGTVLTPFTAPIIGADTKPDPANGRFDIEQAIEHMTSVMSKAERGGGENANEGLGGEKWGGRCWDWKGERIEW